MKRVGNEFGRCMLSGMTFAGRSWFCVAPLGLEKNGWAEFRGLTPPAIVVSPFQGFVLLGLVVVIPALALRAFCWLLGVTLGAGAFA